MTFAEHVRWAKKRTHEYVDRGENSNAITSMLSDLGKHESTAGVVMGCALVAMSVRTTDSHAVRRWIDGCFASVDVTKDA